MSPRYSLDISSSSYPLVLGAVAFLEFLAAAAVARIVTPQLRDLAPERRLRMVMFMRTMVMIVLATGTVHMFVRRGGRNGFGL
jgi:hypothetical protein